MSHPLPFHSTDYSSSSNASFWGLGGVNGPPAAEPSPNGGGSAGPGASSPPRDPTDANACIETGSDRPVMQGADMVEYFSLSPGAAHVVGSADITSVYNNYTFRFSTHENRRKFETNQTRYLPQWGGFCSYGISTENWWTWEQVKAAGPDGNPDVWLILNGHIYFFMYKAPRYYFELLLANSSLPESPIERGDYKWANYTKGEPLTFLNTDCFWSDEDCGMNGNSCWTDDMVV